MKKKVEVKNQPETATIPVDRWSVGRWVGNDGTSEELSFDNDTNGFFLQSDLFPEVVQVPLRAAVHWWGLHNELDGRYGEMEWGRSTSDLFFQVARTLKK